MKRHTQFALLITASLLFVGAFSARNAHREPATQWRWPQVAPLQRDFDVQEVPNAHLELHIRGTDSKPLYLLVCLGLQAGQKSKIDFDWSGDFECRLTSLYSKDLYGTLLTYDPREEKSWESRGRFSPDQILGACAHYPEYGNVRQFRLRGMKLTLSLADVRFETGQVPTGKGTTIPAQVFKSFRLVVGVEPDPGAFSTIAGPVPYVQPKYILGKGDVVLSYSCGAVLPQHVPGIITPEYIHKYRLNPPYPQIVPSSGSSSLPGPNTAFDFADKPLPPKARGFDLPIRDTRGRTVYRFECSSVKPIMRYGISCGLFEIGKEVNLLADSRDAYTLLNRGDIYPEQLDGECANYPDWGAERTFRLRGFRLTVRLSNPVFVSSPYDWTGKGLQKVGISVQVELDKAATLPVAGAPKYAYWNFEPHPNACEVPILNPWYDGE